MKPRTTLWILLAFAVAGVGIGAAARADSFGERSSVAFFVGANAEMPGSFRGQTVPFETSDPGGSTVYHDLRFSDAYDNRYTTGAEFDYAVDPNITAYGRFAYQVFHGQNIQVGTWQSDDLSDSHPVNAKFSDTHAQEYDIGARYLFGMFDGVTPFFGIAVGAEHLAAARADFINVSGTGSTNVTLGQADTVFHQRAETGLQFSPGQSVDFRLTVAANHVDADSKSNDPNLALVGLDPTEAVYRHHWDYPVEFGAALRF
ncbi:MAG TPA: hypothetical protein VGQ27_04585 [Steroidobacteraceae bacterium]|nr:hypothetical protein [Steroidobacteraceae bacterium]